MKRRAAVWLKNFRFETFLRPCALRLGEALIMQVYHNLVNLIYFRTKHLSRINNVC